jgi:hypothetical protein
VSVRRTVTVPTLDHGPVTLTCPAWCTVDHAIGPVDYRADVTHRGPELSLTVPSRHGPAEWLHACVDQAPFSAYDRTVTVVVALGGESARHTPASLRVYADTLAVQLDQVRAYADHIEHIVNGWGVPS